MTEPPANPLADASAALAAASAAPANDVAALYLAVARNSVAKLRDELRELEVLLAAREGKLVRRARPMQTALPVDAKAAP